MFFINRYFAVEEVDELYDAQLAQTSRILEGFIDRPINEIDFDNLNTALLRAVIAYSGEDDDERSADGHGYEGKLVIQIWDEEGNLLVKTPTAPMYALSPLKSGYFLKLYRDFNWYVFTHHTTQNNLWIIVAEREDVRGELTNEISMSYVAGFILITLFLTASLLFAIHRGLKPLLDLSAQISELHIDRLEAVKLEGTQPSELKPVVGAINELMGSVEKDLERERRFLGDVAHELRTPLAGLKLHAQIALTAEDLAHCKQSVGNVLKGIDRSTRLITQLLTLARLDPRALGEKEIVNLGECCHDVWQQLVNSHEKSLTPHRISIAPDLNALEISAYSILIGVMLRNILENACRYSPENSLIVIDGKLTETQQLSISISDEGTGIPEERIASLGNRFFRESPADRQGSGLGLSIVKRIAELHSAEVTFHNRQPHGLAVVIEFSNPI